MFTAKEKRELIREGFSPDEINHLEVQKDPVLWSETYMRNPDNPRKPLHLRWYQKEMLRCPDKRRVYRLGRRAGKSVTLCVDMVWKAFTNSDKQILVCAPYKKQIIDLWKDGFGKLIKGNAFIESSISRIGQNPHTVEFKNGSRILGLTAGTSTGNKGASVRGSSAHDLYLDEVDYMGQEAIQSIMAIMATKKDTTFTISSTPTGKREFYYDACVQKHLGWTEFFYPSSASPEWVSIKEAKEKGLPLHESQEYFLRNSNPEHVYKHEYMAEFGEEAQGVFPHKFIDSSLVQYNPSTEEQDTHGLRWWCGAPQNNDNIYSMGVDWNGDKVGTQIVIVEYFKEPTKIEYMEMLDTGLYSKKPTSVTHQNKYRVYYRESISIENMTQIESIKKIIELNGRFKLDHIYVDSGFGTTNIEELRLYGMKNRNSGILTKLKSIDFHSHLFIWDPFQKDKVKKATKPFMVNSCVNVLERNDLFLPVAEDEKVKLIGQMREYAVERISPQGIPTYTKGNDHILDAFMLAILSFQMEYSELVQVSFAETIGITSKPSLLMKSQPEVVERWDSDEDDPKTKALRKHGVNKRQGAGWSDKYIPNSKGSYMDYEEMTKDKKSRSPFTTNFGRSNWSKTGSPTRRTF